MLSKEAALELLVRLRPIPHLALPLQFDPAPLKADWENLPPDILKPYNTNSNQVYIQELTARSWHGVCLNSYDGGSYTALSETSAEIKGLRPTAVAELVPNMMAVVDHIGVGNQHGLTRLMRVNAGGHLPWHSHFFEYNPSGSPGIIVHVPVLRPERFRYSVVSIREFRCGDPKNVPWTFHDANYAEGQPTIFNSYHMHNVFNDDVTPRISMMIYLGLQHPFVHDLVEDAVKRYSGPLIDV